MFGCGGGGQGLMIENMDALRERGPRGVSPTFIANGLVDSTSGMIAIETGAIGHNVCIVSACATGHPQRRRGCRGDPPWRLHRGHLRVHGDAAARGGPRGLRQHARPGRRRARASRSSRCRGRSTRPATGSSLGEGAGSLFLEDLDLAKARGAKIYAEVVGYGSAADGWDMIQPIEGGTGSARAMKMALERRGVAGRRGRPDQPARHLHAAR